MLNLVRLASVGFLLAAGLVAVEQPARAVDTDTRPCITLEEFNAPTIGETTVGQVRAGVDSPGARLTYVSPMKYLWKRCDGGGNGYAQMAFTKAAGDTQWRVSSKWYQPPAPTIKRGLSGLVVIDPARISAYANDGVNSIDVDGTIKVDWAQIEANQGVFDFTPITSILAAHSGTSFRVRIMAGRDMPGWLDDEDGGCVDIVNDPNAPNGGSGCVPRYWEPGSVYRERYQLLMRKFAEALVANQQHQGQVIDVVNSACTTIFAEPLIIGGDKPSRKALWDAGYRQPKHGECLSWSTEMLTAMFPTTKVSIAGHDKWQYTDANGTNLTSWPLELDFFEDVLGADTIHQLAVEDHGLRVDSDGGTGTLCGATQPASHDWYCYLSHLDPDRTHGWQFTFEGTYQQMEVAAELGADAGACYLETKDFNGMTAAERRNFHNRLLGNCPGD